MRLGKIIRRWRLSNEFSVRQISQEIGIAPSTLIHMEMGKVPPHSATLIAVMQWLLGENNNGTGEDQGRPASAGQESGSEADAAEEQ